MADDIRELLKLAAKATGIQHDGVGYVSPAGIPMNWNPLTNPGDGALMEAHLEIEIYWFDGVVRARAWGVPIVTGAFNGDKQAARMLASLRVAAEIGRRMA